MNGKFKNPDSMKLDVSAGLVCLFYKIGFHVKVLACIVFENPELFGLRAITWSDS